MIKENAQFDLRLDVIIINYNSAYLTIQSLHHLEAIRFITREFTVHVVDNNSPQNDADILKKEIDDKQWNDWVLLKPQANNHGFAGGNNVVLRDILFTDAPPDYVYFLNPDAYPLEGAVEQLLIFLEQHRHVGIAGSLLQDEHGNQQRSAFRFPNILGEFERGISLSIVSRVLEPWKTAPVPQLDTYKVDWVSGASVMVRRQVFDDTGLMDQGYFLYFEETDFMGLAARKNWPTWFVHTSLVVHFAGQSTGLRNGQTGGKPMPKYWFDSWRRYFTKNHGKAYALTACFAWLTGISLYRLHRFLRRRPASVPPKIISNFVTYCVTPILWRNPDDEQAYWFKKK